VLAGLVGVIVDAATGAWYSLDQKNVNAVLEKQQENPLNLDASIEYLNQILIWNDQHLT
jgi:hypothetical protein